MLNIVTKLIGFYLKIINFISPKMGGKQAFYVFCTPFSGKVTDKQQKYFDTAEITDLNVDGEIIKLYKWGSGARNVLCVHGWRSNTYRWKSYINELIQKDCTVYSIDFPAHGNSEGRFWNILKGEASIKAATLHIGEIDSFIAHSVGCFASLYFFDQNPNLQPKKIVSLASAGKVDDFIGEVKKILGLSDKEITNLKTYFETFAKNKATYYNIENFFSNINVKALLIHDEGDKDTDVAYSKRLAKLYPETELMITTGLGHKLRSREVLQRSVDYICKD